jgi:hypothetical protein
MGQIGEPAGLQTHRSGVFKGSPQSGWARLQRVMGRLLREDSRQKSKALLSAP